MAEFFISIFVILLFFVSSFGWGSLVVNSIYGNKINGFAFPIAIGLASWIFIGGVLNSLKLSYPIALYILFAVGVWLSLYFAYLSGRRNYIPIFPLTYPKKTLAGPPLRLRIFAQWSPEFIIIFSFLSLVAMLMPTGLFNYHDDFHTYLPRPVRMLQTGTLNGNPFDGLGFDSLGGQAFLQAFVLLRFPIVYINGFDGIFCFVVSTFLLVEIARRLKIHWGFVTLSILVFVMINPQYVNISSLYSGSMMILALILASLLLTEADELSNIKSQLLRAIPVGLFLSSLIVLKVTFIFFVGLYFVLFIGFSIYLSANKKRQAIIGVILSLIAAFSITPWVSIYSAKYWDGLQLFYSGNAQKSSYESFFSDVATGDITAVFSSEKLLWGGNLLDYNYTMALIGASFILFVFLLNKNKFGLVNQHLVPAIASSGAAIATYFINVSIFRLPTAVRYSCPVFIAVLPALVLLIGCHCYLNQTGWQKGKRHVMPIKHLGPILIFLIFVLFGLFSDVLLERIKRAYHFRTLISFPVSDSEFRYIISALNNQSRERMKIAQSKTEEGQRILSYISLPFHLDFSRNSIFTLNQLSLLSPRLNIPIGENRETMLEYLRKMGIRYVMWEYTGFGMYSNRELRDFLSSPYSLYRRMARYNLNFRNIMGSLIRSSEIIHDDKQIVVLDIFPEAD